MLRFGAVGVTLFLLAVATAAAAPPTVTITSPPDLRGLRGPMVVSYTINPSGQFAELQYDYGTSAPTAFRDANYSGPITSGTFQVSTDGLNEGYLALQVRSDSLAGNEFAESPHVVVVIDRSNPSIALGVNDTDALTGSVNVPINVSDAPINRPDVLVDHASLYVDGVLATTIPQSGLAGGFTLDTTQYADGNHVLRADAVDEAGNTGVSTTKTVSFDNSAPTVTFNGSTPGEGQEVRGGALLFTFALSDAHFPLNVQCRLGDAAFAACTSVNGTNGSHEINVTTPGSYRFEVRATDALGNAGTTARNFRIDGGPPVTTITSGPANGASITVRDVTFAFTVDDPSATTACRLTGPGGGADFGPCSGPGLVHRATGLENGDYVFEVRSTDALGNVETAVGRAFKVAVPGPSSGATAILSRVRNAWTVRDRFTRVALLEVRKVPAGAKVTVICRGRGCPFKRKTFPVRNRRAVLTRAFKKAKLRPKAVLEIRITARNRIGKVVRYKIARKQVPRSTVLCLPVGATTPRAC